MAGWVCPLFEATISGDGTGDGKDGIGTEEALVRAVPSQVGSLVFCLLDLTRFNKFLYKMNLNCIIKILLALAIFGNFVTDVNGQAAIWSYFNRPN